MKLWEKGINTQADVERFTVGKDREMDLVLAPWDVCCNIAHAKMLASVDLLTREEVDSIVKELKNIYTEIIAGKFKIEDGVEDVHSQVELLLTQRIGEAGKKVHSGRSRNDQVLTDIKLFLRAEIAELTIIKKDLFVLLQSLSEKHKDVLLPGYTHLQVAMPSSFGLWFGSYAESLIDDLELLLAAYRVVNKNPLGSAAGYGTSFPLNRKLTTELLGFDTLNYNVVYAQATRGKAEKTLAFAMSSMAATLAKLASDCCLYMSQNFAFISFPDELTTGSSIMPHKKNPDVWELIRAKCNVLQTLPQQLIAVSSNLPGGYFRDFQLTKELIFPALKELKDCTAMTIHMLENIRVNAEVLNDERYNYLFSVEVMNEKVLQGMPLRDAYKAVAAEIQSGSYSPKKEIKHTHEGSIGNLCNKAIASEFEKILQQFNLLKAGSAITKLLN